MNGGIGASVAAAQTTTIWYTGVDGGDGSIGVEFFESQECIDLLEEEDPEYYRGEGGRSFTVTGTHSLEVTTLEEVKERIEEEKQYR